MIGIKVKKLLKDAVVPRYAHDTDTGFDLFTAEELTLEPHGKGIARTGLAFSMPFGWGIMVRNKSGITTKGAPIKTTIDTSTGERADVTIYMGTVDSSYRGEIGIMIKNEEDFEITIPKHLKLAQGVIEKIYRAEFTETEELDETERGTGGYGSTGVGV